MGEFCLLVELPQEESGTKGATLSRSDDQVVILDYLNIQRLKILGFWQPVN